MKTASFLATELIANDHSTWTIDSTIRSSALYTLKELSSIHRNVISGEGKYEITLPTTMLPDAAPITVYDGCRHPLGCSDKT
jgi:hypothetical protein